MKTLFNTMTCHELSELSLFSWPNMTPEGPRHTPPAALWWGDGGALSTPGPLSHPVPPQDLPFAVNKIPGQKKRKKKKKKTKPKTPHLGWKNQYISSGKGEKYPGCESAVGFRIPANTGAKRQNHILLVSV